MHFGTNFGAVGYDQEFLRQYIPAMLFTLYDGYYIYGKYTNTQTDETQYGLRSYIYYSCRYKKGNDTDFIVNYTLDNAITIYGKVNGEYVTKSGYLIGGEVRENGDGVTYNGVEIKPEDLVENLIILDVNGQPQDPQPYRYFTYQNKKVYVDSDGRFFWYDNYVKTYSETLDKLKEERKNKSK